MADAPIGINFIPSTQNQADGPQNLRTDGGLGSGSTDLAQAYKILSLRLPQVVGAQSPTPQSNLTGPGAAGLMLPSGMSSHAALFQAFVNALVGGDPNAMAGMGAPPRTTPAPKVSLGTDAPSGSGLPGAMTPPAPSTPGSSVPPERENTMGYY